jgi:maltose O-acetyltransferase
MDLRPILMKQLYYKFLNSLFRKLENGHTQYLLSKMRCGKNVSIRDRATIHFPENVTISDNVAINSGVTILAQGGVTIGKNTMLAPGVTILTANHDYSKAGEEAMATVLKKPVTIGSGVWIASGAIILPGVKIGDGAVVGAGSVVTSDVPPNVVVAGIPARVQKPRNPA